MRFLRRLGGHVRAVGSRLVRELHWALPGGPGRPHMAAEMEDLETMRRREREVWRRGVDEAD
jgi:hypothetical protein